MGQESASNDFPTAMALASARALTLNSGSKLS